MMQGDTPLTQLHQIVENAYQSDLAVRRGVTEGKRRMAEIFKEEKIPPRRERRQDDASRGAVGNEAVKSGKSSPAGRGKSVFSRMSEEEIARRFSLNSADMERDRRGVRNPQRHSQSVQELLYGRREMQSGGLYPYGRNSGHDDPAADIREEAYRSWREAILKGEIPENVPAFRSMQYSSRLLLEMIGTGSHQEKPPLSVPPQRGLEILETLGKKKADGNTVSGFEGIYVTRAIQSYIVFHDLPRAAVQKHFAAEIAEDELLLALIYWDEAGEDQLYAGICRYGKFAPEKSKFCLEHAEEMKTVLCRAFCAWARRYQEINESSPGLEIAGPVDCAAWLPYRGFLTFSMSQAQGYRRLPYRSFMIDLMRRYEYDGVRWKLMCHFPDLYGNMEVHRKLQELCRETERQLREALHFGHKLKQRSEDEELQKLIRSEIGRYLREREEASRPKVSIDVGKLVGIRSDADYTFAQLVKGTEEETGPAMQEPLRQTDEDPAVAAPDQEPSAPQTESPGKAFFSPAEVHFLEYLFLGDSAGAEAYARQQHLIVSILEDSINEKMLDEIGDYVIEEGDGGPSLVEDYASDVRARLA